MVCLSPRHGGGPRSEFITLRFEHTAPHDRIHRYGGRCARECTDAGGLLTIISLLALAVSLRLPPHFRNRAGGYSQPGGDGKKGNEPTLAKSALGFSFGVSSSLSILGVFSTVVGSTYGQTGPVLPCLASSVAIAMGLNLLEVVQLGFPSAFQNFDPKSLSVDLPPVLRSYLAGLAFAFVSSPCSTPVLATLLAYVSTLENPGSGGGLLLAYAAGYVTPLLVAATATENLKRIPAIRKYSQWINPASGMLLVAGGTYFFLDSVTATLPA